MPQHKVIQRIAGEDHPPRRSPRLQSLAFRLKEKSNLSPRRSPRLAALTFRPKPKRIQQQQHHQRNQQQSRHQTESRGRISKPRLKPLVLIPRQYSRTDEEYFHEIFDSQGIFRGTGLNILFPEEYEDPLKELKTMDADRVSSGRGSGHRKMYGQQASVMINGKQILCLR